MAAWKTSSSTRGVWWRCDLTQAVVLDQVGFKVNADTFKQFVAMFNAPVYPNPGLERLMAAKPPWNTGQA